MKSELIKEVWKPVPGYEQLYTASNFGRVMSLNRHYILKFYKDWCGYLRVTLSKNGKAKHFKVHRLVYETFIGAIPEGMQVNHINELKTDNSVWNLNLMTPKENTNYGLVLNDVLRNTKVINRHNILLKDCLNLFTNVI